MPEFHIGDKVFVRYHVRDLLYLKYDSTYKITLVQGEQLEVMDDNSKAYKINVQDVKPVYPIE